MAWSSVVTKFETLFGNLKINRHMKGKVNECKLSRSDSTGIAVYLTVYSQMINNMCLFPNNK